MTPAEEQAYLQGNRAAYRRLLSLCAGELVSEDKSLAAALAQLEDVRAVLRRLCAAYGDNSWTDDMHLGDVAEKYLERYLDDAAEHERDW